MVTGQVNCFLGASSLPTMRALSGRALPLRRQSRGHVADQLHVHAGVHFRVELSALRHAVERGHFRQHQRERAALLQRAQEGRGRCAAECAHQLLPHALRDELGEFAGRDHLPHQRARFVGNAEAERRETRHEPRRAQHP